MRHHGESLRALTGNNGLTEQLELDPLSAALENRQRALVDYALKLTSNPDSMTKDDIENLRQAGLSDSAIHDCAAIVAYFNFVNRIALGLNVELEAEYRLDSSGSSD